MLSEDSCQTSLQAFEPVPEEESGLPSYTHWTIHCRSRWETAQSATFSEQFSTNRFSYVKNFWTRDGPLFQVTCLTSHPPLRKTRSLGENKTFQKPTTRTHLARSFKGFITASVSTYIFNAGSRHSDGQASALNRCYNFWDGVAAQDQPAGCHVLLHCSSQSMLGIFSQFVDFC